MGNKIKELAKKSKYMTNLYNRIIRNRKMEPIEVLRYE